MKLEITQSMVHLYEKCGRAFQFRYMEGLKIAPQSALTVGRSVDEGITHNLLQKIHSEKDVSTEEVVDVVVTTFNREASETDWQGEDPGVQKDIAVKLVSVHHKELAPAIAPKAVQVKLQAELSDYILGGTLDLIEKDSTIVDSKTSKDKYDDDSVGKSLQPAVYTYLYEKNYGTTSKGFRYDVMVKPKELKTKSVPPSTQKVFGEVSEKQKAVALMRADALHKAIKSGAFHYAPDGAWNCSQKWCGYWNICERGGK